jgi:hypothetical protein
MTITKNIGVPPDTLALLDDRVPNLPLDVIPWVVDWNELVLGKNSNTNTNTKTNHHEHKDHAYIVVPVQVLRNAIPFQKDVIITRKGSSVTERRGTTWVADEGNWALAFSGKLVAPNPIPDLVGRRYRTAPTEDVPADELVQGGILKYATTRSMKAPIEDYA